jgi:hypothetical protein
MNSGYAAAQVRNLAVFQFEFFAGRNFGSWRDEQRCQFGACRDPGLQNQFERLVHGTFFKRSVMRPDTVSLATRFRSVKSAIAAIPTAFRCPGSSASFFTLVLERVGALFTSFG